jgi:hypothetical protein
MIATKHNHLTNEELIREATLTIDKLCPTGIELLLRLQEAVDDIEEIRSAYEEEIAIWAKRYNDLRSGAVK